MSRSAGVRGDGGKGGGARESAKAVQGWVGAVPRPRTPPPGIPAVHRGLTLEFLVHIRGKQQVTTLPAGFDGRVGAQQRLYSSRLVRMDACACRDASVGSAVRACTASTGAFTFFFSGLVDVPSVRPQRED